MLWCIKGVKNTAHQCPELARAHKPRTGVLQGGHRRGKHSDETGCAPARQRVLLYLFRGWVIL